MRFLTSSSRCLSPSLPPSLSLQALSGLKNFDDLVVFMQKNGLSNQQVEAALEAQEAGNTEAVQKILAGTLPEQAFVNSCYNRLEYAHFQALTGDFSAAGGGRIHIKERGGLTVLLANGVCCVYAYAR